MNKFRSRLLVALITLIILVLVALGLLLGQIFKSTYVHSFNQRMIKEAGLVALMVEEKGYLPKRLDSISSALNSSVIILNRDGQAIYETTKGRVGEEILNKIKRGLQKQIARKAENPSIVIEDQNTYYYGVPIKDGRAGFVVLSASVSSLSKVNQQIWGLLISSLGLALIVIIILGLRITKQYTKPIESATHVAIELAKGNFSARTYEDRLDETGMLSQSINILARNLQDMTKAQEMQQDRLQTLIENMGSGLILIDGRGYINLVNRAYKETFEVDPSEYLYRLYYEAFRHKEIISLVEEIFMTEVKVRKQLLLPLTIERRHFEVYGAPIIGTNDEWKGIVLVFHDITELKKLEQMRKDFVANVSHELKTPITSIKGFSETLLDGAMKDGQTLENFLSIILKESDRLQSLIQDLLDLSKIEQQGFKLNIQPVDIKEVLEDIIIILKGKAEEKNISLEFAAGNGFAYVSGDIYRLKQIFINLINNSIAYTPQDGFVKVSLDDIGGEVKISISDSGIGIEEEEIPRIFERFYRVDKARSRNSGGTGLGLAIVKHLVEAHHGYITVSSEVGKGTAFTVILNKEWRER